ncbi:MAG: murein biosynthesis integral membrane protein MurJ, partial [Synergistaceae bacterium]|nr:murein biosynthesis integral membrane protein MurJ [Synergistaceae bacterium]
MVDQQSNSQMSGMAGRAMRMMAGTLASRALGLFREVLTARFFGATPLLDAFNAAYIMANLSRQLLAEGALSASFVPVFSRVHQRDGGNAARALAQQTWALLLIVGPVVVLLGIVASPLLIRLLAPGFEPEQARLAVSLTRALFPFLLIISAGALAMGILNSVGSFFVPAVAPAASNLVFIIILLAFSKNISIWIMVAAVLIGGLCNMGMQWGMAWRLGYPPLPSKPDMSNPDMRRMLSLFLPYAAGLSLNQINPVISRVLASFLGGGVISVLNFADRIIQLPLGIFVIAISQAVLPMLSRLNHDDKTGFRTFIRDALRFNLFIVFPASLAIILLSSPIVHILYVRGAFRGWAWAATSGVLACYAAGLPGMACNTIIMRALYARGMAKAAVRVTAFTVAANLVLGLALMSRFSYLGLAAGTSAAFTGAAFLGAYLLSRDIGMNIKLFDFAWFARLSVSCLLMCGALYAAMTRFPYGADDFLSRR